MVGGNGAGKTTLMRILQGVDRPDEGCVILDVDGAPAAPARRVCARRRHGAPGIHAGAAADIAGELYSCARADAFGGLIDLVAARAEADRLARDRRRFDRLGCAPRTRRCTCVKFWRSCAFSTAAPTC